MKIVNQMSLASTYPAKVIEQGILLAWLFSLKFPHYLMGLL